MPPACLCVRSSKSNRSGQVGAFFADVSEDLHFQAQRLGRRGGGQEGHVRWIVREQLSEGPQKSCGFCHVGGATLNECSDCWVTVFCEC